MATRHPNPAEQALYRKVFANALPAAERIYISDALGAGGRPWTQPRWFQDLSTRLSDEPAGGFRWQVNIGPNGFADCTSSAKGSWGYRIDSTFIHELTHVWQGFHGTFPDTYAIRALVSQARAEVSSYDPYIYSLGKEWSDYTIEQKAEIVEDWYLGGMTTSDPRFSYVKDNVQAGIY